MPTLATLLGRHGFETGAIVNSPLFSPDFGLGRGFDHYQVVAQDPSPKGAAGKVTAGAIRWLKERGKRPSFLFVHYFDVHSDYRSLPRYERRFAPEQGRLEGTTAELVRGMNGSLAIEPADVRQLVGLYDAGIRQLDDELGRFFDWLRESGWLETSLVIVTSDHGEQFWEHNSFLHVDHYEENLRVPLLMRAPSLPHGVRIGTPASGVDIVPTVLGVLGLPGAEGVDGMDLHALWAAPDDEPRERWLVSEAGPSLKSDIRRSVQNSRHKLILELGGDRRELYDLLDDPGEQQNLADDEPRLLKQLLAALEPFMASGSEAPRAPELSSDGKAELRALGYVE
jgi:arylsulfatase A-like enzyme